ncbi:hypothetical protein C8J56DRAFT_1162539, partial [Mycena floridula]
ANVRDFELRPCGAGFICPCGAGLLYRRWDAKPVESLGDYKPCCAADNHRWDVKPVLHSSTCGPADTDHVERCVQAQGQIEQVAVSLASSQPTSAR